MKKKYRTHKGEIVELDQKELEAFPFNSRLEYVGKVEEKKRVYKKKVTEEDTNDEDLVS